jgi:signal transduction histidine kinase
MSRTPVAQFERTPLDEVVEQVVRLVRVQAERRRVELRRTGEALPEGYADAARLKQALLNVVLNAVEATAPGTEVTVGTRTGVDDTGRRLVEFVIQDQGPGIPRDRRELIFQPFATTKESGTGLGLAVTRQIVTDHGGCIEVEGEEGAGATFVVRMPLERPVRTSAAC